MQVANYYITSESLRKLTNPIHEVTMKNLLQSIKKHVKKKEMRIFHVNSKNIYKVDILIHIHQHLMMSYSSSFIVFL